MLDYRVRDGVTNASIAEDGPIEILNPQRRRDLSKFKIPLKRSRTAPAKFRDRTAIGEGQTGMKTLARPGPDCISLFFSPSNLLLGHRRREARTSVPRRIDLAAACLDRYDRLQRSPRRALAHSSLQVTTPF